MSATTEKKAKATPPVAWKVDYKQWTVRSVECPNGIQWPNPDADGTTIYDNTHFHRRADAVHKLQANAKAGIATDRAAIERAEREIERLKNQIVAATAALLIEQIDEL